MRVKSSESRRAASSLTELVSSARTSETSRARGLLQTHTPQFKSIIVLIRQLPSTTRQYWLGGGKSARRTGGGREAFGRRSGGDELSTQCTAVQVHYNSLKQHPHTGAARDRLVAHLTPSEVH